jgi:hypothetical protein
MTERQLALIKYHRDLAEFAVSKEAPVFVILDLEDPDGFAIAAHYQTNCADRRDAIRESGSIPALTLAMSVKDANKFIAQGWPSLKRLSDPPPKNMIPTLLISEERCLSVQFPTS